MSTGADDAKRIDWLQEHQATIYCSIGKHWVVVDECAKIREGCTGNTLREAVDAASGKKMRKVAR